MIRRIGLAHSACCAFSKNTRDFSDQTGSSSLHFSSRYSNLRRAGSRGDGQSRRKRCGQGGRGWTEPAKEAPEGSKLNQ